MLEFEENTFNMLTMPLPRFLVCTVAIIMQSHNLTAKQDLKGIGRGGGGVQGGSEPPFHFNDIHIQVFATA